jgi:two-component system response regulator
MSEPYLLLVEDNEDDVFFTLRTLRNNGFSAPVIEVGDGVEALSLLGETPMLPAMVLVDSRLPKMSGEELVQALRADQRTSELPILLLTGSEERRHICGQGEAYSSGADGCLSKPLSWRAFRRALRRLGLKKSLAAEVEAAPASIRLPRTAS